jgi:hypothetical protein
MALIARSSQLKRAMRQLPRFLIMLTFVGGIVNPGADCSVEKPQFTSVIARP